MLLLGTENNINKSNTKLICLLIVICVLNVFFISCNKIDSQYQNKITELLKTDDTVELSDIFDLDFDYAYLSKVPDESYFKHEHFIKKLNVESEIKLNSLDSEGFGRILFIEDDTIIYDFIYDTSKWIFYETGIYLQPETDLTFGETDQWGRPIIQVDIQE